MNPLPSSNLQVRSNLLGPETFHADFRSLSVFELRDVDRRHPNLALKESLSFEQAQEWRQSLFWGDQPPPLNPLWTNAFAPAFEALVAELERRPMRESAFELLAVLRWNPDADPRAAEWDRRVVEVLARDEFKMIPGMIDSLIASILGR